MALAIGNSGLPATGKEKSWGVGLADIDKDGVLDIGVAFGDVLSPTWHSGPHKADKAKTETGQKKDDKKPADKPGGPQRGMFGSVEVWRGVLRGK
jgi:hypothetical protein